MIGWKYRAFGAKNILVFNLGVGEIAVIVVVALIFLGPKMLPEIATGLGKIIREIRKSTADIRQDLEFDDMIRGPLQELRDAATLPPEELKRRDEARAARAAEEEARRKREAAQAEEVRRKAAEAEAEAEAQRKRETAQAEEVRRKAAEAAQAEEVRHKAAEAAQAEEVRHKAAEAKEEVRHKAAEAKAEAQRNQHAVEEQAKAADAALAKPSGPSDVVSAGGTMILNPPPSSDMLTLTPLPELHSPPPVMTAKPPRLPPPPLPAPRPAPSGAKPAMPSDATVVDLQAQLNAAAAAQRTIAGRPAPTPQLPRPLPPRLPDSKKG